jgi:protein-tyrosine phosphatase
MHGKSLLDIHTHVLPSLDDGAPNLESALKMLQRAKGLGMTTVVATPHVRRARDIDACRAAFKQFFPQASGTGIRLMMGFEVNFRMLEDLNKVRECVIEGTNRLLLELPENTLMPNWDSILLDLKESNILPIIAHPERYRYIQMNIDSAAQIRSFGCEMQIDARSLTLNPFSQEGRCAKKLLREGLCDYVASDAHRPEGYDYFEKAYAKHRENWPSGALE